MCSLIRLLYRLIPWRPFRDLLIRRHYSGCPKCGPAPAAPEPWEEAIRPPDWILRSGSLWPEIRKGLEERGRTVPAPRTSGRRRRPGLNWAVAAAGTMGCLLLVLLIRENRRIARLPGGPDGARVVVISAEVQGRNADSFLFQTKTASFIWFAPTSSEGDRP